MTRSNFPNSVDSFTELSEVLASDKTDVDRYKVLLVQETRTATEETELTNLKNKLANKLVSSEHFNYLQDAIKAVQDFFLNETVPYLSQLEVGVLKDDLGSVEYLETNDKSNLVNAVNELNESIEIEKINTSNVFDDLYSKKADKTVAQMTKITGDTGNVKISLNNATDDILRELENAGQGMHTFYAASGSKNLPPTNKSIRGISHFTSSDIGWVMATDYSNNIFTNYFERNTTGWHGWRELSTNEQRTLWDGAAYGHQNIVPTKPLSKCRNGWILIWSDYDVGVGANNFDFNFSYIPKAYASLHNGSNAHFIVSNYVSDSSTNFVHKVFGISNTTLIGKSTNDLDSLGNKDVVLRYVLEW